MRYIISYMQQTNRMCLEFSLGLGLTDHETFESSLLLVWPCELKSIGAAGPERQNLFFKTPGVLCTSVLERGGGRRRLFSK